MNFQELKQIALANPRGKIVANGATGNDVNNVGSWNEIDTTGQRDIYEDIRQAIARLSGKPTKIIGSHDTLKGFCLSADLFMRGRWSWETIAPLFWFPSDKFPNYEMQFIQFDDSADDGLVILTGSDGSAVLIDTR